MTVNSEPIIVAHTFNASVKTVWKAITNVDQMRQWFFNNIEDFEPIIGFKTQFKVQSEDRVFTHLWTITEVEPLKKIVYNWKYEECAGDSFVYFELFQLKSETKIRVTSVVTESFPANIPEFKAESCLNGWTYFIKQNLKKFLESKT
ncbi:MAG: SRPBCC domain-containing protein [Bacteroidetes bacterium]|nr:SRPBCC domain-containing protein [Bacteroidota bacterium]